MSDSVSETAISGSISPRNVDTVRYKVLKEVHGFAVGEVFAAWPQGEVYSNINGLLSTVRNSDIVEWVADKLVERV